MKVKNIMFFGFAAAILSAAGAQAAATATFSPAVSAPDAAGRQIVSSKSYVDSVATNIAGQLKSVAVTGDYNDLDNKPTVDTTFDINIIINCLNFSSISESFSILLSFISK